MNHLTSTFMIFIKHVEESKMMYTYFLIFVNLRVLNVGCVIEAFIILYFALQTEPTACAHE